jgi:hypothetical protein
MSADVIGGATAPRRSLDPVQAQRWVSYFHELDAWTEYWDVYHPESRGRYYFGDDDGEPGLLSLLLPRASKPPLFTAWTRLALGSLQDDAFATELTRPEVAAAVIEVDGLVERLFARHFGDPREDAVQRDYLAAMFHFAADLLPRADERDAKIDDDDPRKPTAGRHTLDGDVMWFAWALHTEAAARLLDGDTRRARHGLVLAGVATACPVHFAWRGHRSTRPEYRRDDATIRLLRERGLRWANDLDAARREIHALYRIREYGQDPLAAR